MHSITAVMPQNFKKVACAIAEACKACHYMDERWGSGELGVEFTPLTRGQYVAEVFSYGAYLGAGIVTREDF